MTKDELKAKYKDLTGEEIDGTNAEIEAAIKNVEAGETPAPPETQPPETNKGKSAKYVVEKPFHDKLKSGKKYKEGDDVSHFDEERLKAAISRGLVKKA